MKKLLSMTVLASALFLTACEEKASYQLKSDTVTSTLTYYHENNKVLREKIENNIDVAALEKQGVKAEDFKNYLAEAQKQYQSVKGISYSSKVDAKHANETIEIDYAMLDYAKAKTALGYAPDAEVEKNKGPAFDKTAKQIESQGYKKLD